MGFRITWDADQVIRTLRSCASQAASPYNDGFTAWRCKQDLLTVKYALDEMLESMPTFAGEDEFRREHEKQQMWKRLQR